MKIHISADIEGVTGVTVADETNKDHKDFVPFAEQMTKEVVAACDGALEAGATDILVKDAHWSARNIIAHMLPREARLLRGWSGHPQSMVDGLDETFAASMFIGYHSRAGSAGNPLAHTQVGPTIQEILINETPTSEFRIAAYTSNMHGVPTAFLSGDEALCQEAKDYCDGMGTFATFKGRGLSTESRHPEQACEDIRKGVHEVLSGDLTKLLRTNPDRYKVRIEYKLPPTAYRRSFYPGARLENERFIVYETTDWFDVLRLFGFVL